jgi:hypothetical protein
MGVRDPDMFGQATEYVRETLLEPGLGAGHVRCGDLTQGKADGPNMSGLGTRYVR